MRSFADSVLIRDHQDVASGVTVVALREHLHRNRERLREKLPDVIGNQDVGGTGQSEESVYRRKVVDPFDTAYGSPLIYTETYGLPYYSRRVYGSGFYLPAPCRSCGPCAPCGPSLGFNWHNSSLGFFFRW